MSFSEPYEITVDELKDWLQEKKTFTMLDVREPWELAEAAFEGCQHIRLDELEDNLERIDPTQPVVIVCHHGRRSLTACYYLRSQGFRNVTSLKGGIHLWALRIDPSIKIYHP